MALNATDRLLAGYLGLVTLLLLARGPFADGNAWLLAAHLLFAAALIGFRRLPSNAAGLGRAVHVLYPLVLLSALYAEIGIINQQIGLAAILRHDAVVQHWDRVVFGEQVSYDWIRQAPSVFWSGLLHFAYLFYYAIVLLPVPILAARGHWDAARGVVFAMMLAYVACYVVFLAYPVAGPNYAFPHPSGAVREVWSARLVYAALGAGSSVGAAFPSSHVAATVAAVAALWRAWRPLALLLVVPAALLAVAVVYCQMHYGVDAVAGISVGAIAALVAPRLRAAGSGTPRRPADSPGVE
jgi:membrane-associated phospholipid phosphatase